MQTLLCDYVDSAAEAFARCQSAVMVVIRVLPILERQDLESISSRRNPIRPIHGEMILHWMKLSVFHTLKEYQLDCRWKIGPSGKQIYQQHVEYRNLAERGTIKWNHDAWEILLWTTRTPYPRVPLFHE